MVGFLIKNGPNAIRDTMTRATLRFVPMTIEILHPTSAGLDPAAKIATSTWGGDKVDRSCREDLGDC